MGRYRIAGCPRVLAPQLQDAPASFSPGDLGGYWYHTGGDLRLGSGANTGKWDRLDEQNGSGIYLQNPTFTGQALQESAVNDAYVIGFDTASYLTTDGDSGALGWVTSGNAITMLIFGRLGYTAGFSSFIVPASGGTVYPKLERRSAAPTVVGNNRLRNDSTNGLGVAGAGAANINYNTTTSANLISGQSTPFQLMEFLFSTTEKTFRRNNTVQETSSGSFSLQNYDGSQLRMAANEPAIFLTDLIIIPDTLTDEERNNMAAWILSTYNYTI